MTPLPLDLPHCQADAAVVCHAARAKNATLGKATPLELATPNANALRKEVAERQKKLPESKQQDVEKPLYSRLSDFAPTLEHIYWPLSSRNFVYAQPDRACHQFS